MIFTIIAVCAFITMTLFAVLDNGDFKKVGPRELYFGYVTIMFVFYMAGKGY